ncbi:MAG: HPF/RaiA family ribosome-associated protein [Candidatus Baltobacteraceae bacterium]
MSLRVQITYRGVDPSDALSRLIRKEAAKLDKFFDGIVSCRVLVERQYGHHRSGSPFHVRLNIAVPGAELAIAAEPSLRTPPLDDEPKRLHKSDEIDAIYRDPELTVRDAFRRAKRRVQEYARRKA